MSKNILYKRGAFERFLESRLCYTNDVTQFKSIYILYVHSGDI